MLGLDEALATIEATPKVVRTILGAAAGADMSTAPDRVWGPREVLEHLVDVEGIAFRDRIGRILHEDRPFIRSIDPPSRLEEGGYAERSVEGLLTEFESLRTESVKWLHSIDPADYAREGEHDAAGTIKVGELIHYWAVHDLTYLGQMVTALRDGLVPAVGNMHLFLEG